MPEVILTSVRFDPVRIYTFPLMIYFAAYVLASSITRKKFWSVEFIPNVSALDFFINDSDRADLKLSVTMLDSDSYRKKNLQIRPVVPTVPCALFSIQ